LGLELTVAEAEEQADVAATGVGCREVDPAVAVEVTGHQGARAIPDGQHRLRAERPVPVTQEHTQVVGPDVRHG
jgi:hypothetical protein